MPTKPQVSYHKSNLYNPHLISIHTIYQYVSFHSQILKSKLSKTTQNLSLLKQANHDPQSTPKFIIIFFVSI